MADAQVQEIIGMLEGMRDGKQTSVPDILAKLNLLKDRFDSAQKYWVDRTDDDSFYFFEASENPRLILEQIATIMGSIPQNLADPKFKYFRTNIPKDVLPVLPIMGRILKLSADSKPKAKIDQRSIDAIIRANSQLRDKARKHNVSEPIEIHKAAIPKDMLFPIYDTMMKMLRDDAVPHEAKILSPEVKNVPR